MIEATVERHLVKMVKRAGGEIRKVRWIGRRGAPDRLVLMKHPFSIKLAAHSTCHFFVELKRPGGTLRPEQEREHTILRESGITVLVFDSKDSIDFFFAKDYD